MSDVSIGHIVRSALFPCLLAMLSACSKSATTGAAPDAEAAIDASTPSLAARAAVDGHALAVASCLSCHSESMLAQQRLTSAQWAKVVTKMAGWGANLEPAEVGPLVTYLSATYGPDAGGYEPETLSPADAIGELAPLPDAPLPTGDAARGHALYADKCSGCHGADARGHVGVTLIDRPFLYRAADFARTVRKGRGKMLALPLTDAEIGDVLAHLRSLRNAPP